MENRFLSIKELVEPIIGGFWGETTENGNGNARVIRNGDILDTGEINEAKIPERKLTDKEINKSKLNHRDIVITMSGNVGRVARIRNEKDENGKPYVASNFIKILRVKKDLILPEYLFFILRSEEFKKHINKHIRGVAIQNLSIKIFDQKIIPIISQKEQKEIVDLLEQAEELKNKRTEANQKIEELMPALFNEMFGDLSKYTKVKLKDGLATFKYGTSIKCDYDDKKTPVLRIPNIIDGNINIKDLKYGNLSMKDKNQLLLKYGDLIFVRTNGNPDYVGRCAHFNIKGEYTFASYLIRARVNKEILNPDFLSEYLRLQIGRKNMLPAIRTTAGQSNINTEGLGNMHIPLPPIEIQNDFAHKIKDIMLYKEKQDKLTKKLDEIYLSLMSRFFYKI